VPGLFFGHLERAYNCETGYGNLSDHFPVNTKPVAIAGNITLDDRVIADLGR